jgi:hypothetical protein
MAEYRPEGHRHEGGGATVETQANDQTDPQPINFDGRRSC